MKPVIFDTGPLVAWFCPRDEHNAWARETFKQIPAGGFICEAVLAEVCHLVAKNGIARGKVLEFVERGGLISVPLSGELHALRELLDRYQRTHPWILRTPALSAWLNFTRTSRFARRMGTSASSARTVTNRFGCWHRSQPDERKLWC